MPWMILFVLKAAFNRHPDIAKALILFGAKVDATNHFNASPLHHSRGEWDRYPGRREVARILIESGASLEIKSSAWDTPMGLDGDAMRSLMAEIEKDRLDKSLATQDRSDASEIPGMGL